MATLRRSSRRRKSPQNINYGVTKKEDDPPTVNDDDNDNDKKNDNDHISDDCDNDDGDEEKQSGKAEKGKTDEVESTPVKTRKRKSTASSRKKKLTSRSNTPKGSAKSSPKSNAKSSAKKRAKKSAKDSSSKSSKGLKRIKKEEEVEYKNDDENDDDDDDNDDDDNDEAYAAGYNDEEEEEEEIQSTRKRKRPSSSRNSTSASSTSSPKATSTATTTSSPRRKKKERNYGSVEDRTCPFCKKVFSIITGLAYHIEHKVCQNEAFAKSSRKKNKPGTFPHQKLERNSKFITPFGVVAVVSDSRAPADHNKTCISSDGRERNRIYSRKKDRIYKRKVTVMMYNAKRQRRRRKQLMDIYLEDLEQKKKNINNNDNGHEANVSNQIWKQYCTLTTPQLILSGKYHQHLDTKMIRQVTTVEKHPCNDLGEDPLIPPDSYPDRIVECVLIQDERRTVCSLDTGAEGEGRLSQMKVSRKSIEMAKRELRMRKDSIGDEEKDEEDDDITEEIHESGLKLYLKRNLLMNIYNKKIPKYQCAKCGLLFSSRMGLKGHIAEQTCLKRVVRMQEERALRLEEIEEDAMSNNFKAPQPLATPKKGAKAATKGASGSKSKRKPHKKWPAWLEFYPALSPIYPEIFDLLKFKRGSNNSKFMQKKWDNIGSARKKIRKSRAKKNLPHNVALSVVKDVESWIKDNSQQSVYPEVMLSLFPELRSSSSSYAQSPTTSPRRSTSRRASQRARERLSTLENDGLKVEVDGDGEYNPQNELDFHNMDIDNDDYELNCRTPMPELPLSPLPSERTMPPLPNVHSPSIVQSPLTTPIAAPLLKPTAEAVVTVPTISTSTNKSDPPNSKTTLVSPSAAVPILSTAKKRRKRKRAPLANPKPVTPIIVDIRPLVEEVRAGRYPSMKEYTGDHSDICFLCKNKGDDVYFCEFCENSEHLACVQSKVTIRDPEPDDEFMCHRCIQTVMARRSRAEKRRLQKLDEAMGISNGTGTGGEDGTNGITIQDAKAASALKREVIWNQPDFDAHVVSYTKCPSGGPGGLICCSTCTAAYSRLLSETSKEMDSQTVSSVGREVSELFQLLHDAKVRLQQSVDVANANDTRMSLLNDDQAGFDHSNKSGDDSGLNNGHGHVSSIMGFMDMISGK